MDNLSFCYGSTLYRHIVDIPMGAHFVADLVLSCYERYFICSLFDNNQSDVVKVFSSTSRYLDDILNSDTPYF